MSEQPSVQEYRQQKFQLPPGATDLVLVRHGESRAASVENPFPLVDGHGDPELAPQGRSQAEAVGARLRDWQIDAVYVTNLRRTAETAAPLLSYLQIEARVEPDLREVFLGDWEGGEFRIRSHQNDPLIVKMREQERWDVIPNAESHESLRARVRRALDRIADAHANQTVVAFVHGGIVGHILSEASGATPFAFNGCENGAISRVVMVDGQMMVRGFNDVSHLDDARSTSALPT